MRIWRAQPDEAREVARLLSAFRDHYGKSWPSDESFRATVGQLIGREDSEYLLGAAADGDPPVAVAQLRYRLSVWTATDDCWLEDLYVADEARGAGLGAAMVQACLERARERGCRRIELDVDVENAPARALYARMGFRDKAEGGSLFLQRRIEPPGGRG